MNAAWSSVGGAPKTTPRHRPSGTAVCDSTSKVTTSGSSPTTTKRRTLSTETSVALAPTGAPFSRANTRPSLGRSRRGATSASRASSTVDSVGSPASRRGEQLGVDVVLQTNCSPAHSAM